jgi:hypothetical protein
MNYNFLYKEISDIDLQIIDQLQNYALSVDYGDNLGFYKGKGIRTHKVEDFSNIKIIFNALQNIVDPNNYLNAYINVIPPNLCIPEHSDLGENKFFQDNDFIHKIHIPLITSPESGQTWRCPYKENKIMAVHFKRGKAYLFNNVIPHSSINFSDSQSRYHLILRCKKEAISESFYQ